MCFWSIPNLSISFAFVGRNNKKTPAPVKPPVLKEPPPIDVPAMSLVELKEKTQNFGSKALIGEGSYGRVYYANFNDGKAVAVKKLDNASEPETNVEFLTQVSKVSRLKSDNFVQLLGYCVEGNLRVLAYEFATMRSLHDILHGKKDFFLLKHQYGLGWRLINLMLNREKGSARSTTWSNT